LFDEELRELLGDLAGCVLGIGFGRLRALARKTDSCRRSRTQLR
jgi:hypothetical protein